MRPRRVDGAGNLAMFESMPSAPPPLPPQIPPLRWRSPAVIWTPVALALAIGWPLLALRGDGLLADATSIGAAVAFALGLVSLGLAWGFGKPPRTYRDVIAHVLRAGLIVSLVAPFLLNSLIELVSQAQDRQGLPFSAALTMVPLSLLVGLPVAFFSGVVFALVAFVKQPKAAPAEQAHDVQPFR